MKTSQNHLPSLLGSLLFITAALLFLSASLLMGVTSLSTFFTDKAIEARGTIIMAVTGIEGLILLVATFISIQKFLRKDTADKDSSFSITAMQIVICLIMGGAAIFVGEQVSENMQVNWLLLPVLTIPAVLLPILVILGLGIQKLPLGPRWQSWNIFGMGMTLIPFILVFLEVFAIVFIFILVVAFLVSQPDIPAEMERLSRQLYLLDPQSQAARDLLIPLINKPAVLAVALGYFSVIVPLLEELFKPLGVWIFSRQLSTRAQGFALGALSGAAYALIETLGVSAQTTDWATLLFTRIGTDTLHITTSALMGAAIVNAIQGRKYLQLLGTYILAVSLHGLWNALAILFTLSTLGDYLKDPGPLGGMQLPLNIGMGILAVLLLVILVVSNRKMRATIPKPVELSVEEDRNEVNI